MPNKNILDSIKKRAADVQNGEPTWKEISMEEQDEVLEPLVEYINYIKSDGIRHFVRSCLHKAPEEFWTYSSYLTGEDHPPDELVTGGTIKHVQRCFRACREISIAMQFSERECDVLFAAVLLHDITKFVEDDEGEIAYNEFHPYTTEEYFKRAVLEDHEASDEFNLGSVATDIEAEDYLNIARLIRVHQGYYSLIPETTPQNNLEWAMHLSDLIGTRVHYIVDDEPPKWRWDPENEDD